MLPYREESSKAMPSPHRTFKDGPGEGLGEGRVTSSKFRSASSKKKVRGGGMQKYFSKPASPQRRSPKGKKKLSLHARAKDAKLEDKAVEVNTPTSVALKSSIFLKANEGFENTIIRKKRMGGVTMYGDV